MTETINERIKRFRIKSGFTQAQLGKMLGIKTSTYSQMERKGIVTCKTLIKLTEIFQTDALTLLYGEEHKEKIEKPLLNAEETIKITDSYEIQPLVTQNIYEKIAVIAMRAFPYKRKQEIYEYIIEQPKCI